MKFILILFLYSIQSTKLAKRMIFDINYQKVKPDKELELIINQEVCAICHDFFQVESTVETECKHYYHEDW